MCVCVLVCVCVCVCVLVCVFMWNRMCVCVCIKWWFMKDPDAKGCVSLKPGLMFHVLSKGPRGDCASLHT